MNGLNLEELHQKLKML